MAHGKSLSFKKLALNLSFDMSYWGFGVDCYKSTSRVFIFSLHVGPVLLVVDFPKAHKPVLLAEDAPGCNCCTDEDGNDYCGAVENVLFADLQPQESFEPKLSDPYPSIKVRSDLTQSQTL